MSACCAACGNVKRIVALSHRTSSVHLLADSSSLHVLKQSRCAFFGIKRLQISMCVLFMDLFK